jgi:hypothetical protein
MLQLMAACCRGGGDRHGLQKVYALTIQNIPWFDAREGLLIGPRNNLSADGMGEADSSKR